MISKDILRDSKQETIRRLAKYLNIVNADTLSIEYLVSAVSKRVKKKK